MTLKGDDSYLYTVDMRPAQYWDISSWSEQSVKTRDRLPSYCRNWSVMGRLRERYRLNDDATSLRGPRWETIVEQIAHVGHITSLNEVDATIEFKFEEDTDVPPIGTGVIEQLSSELDASLDQWGWHRTRWSVKDVDLYEVLLKNVFLAATTSGSEGSGAISFPTTEARDSSLVAVMMPFDTKYDAVYDTIKEAVSDAGLYCQRVDDIWNSDHIMADVASLLWRAEVIVADLTGRNPNVFYEVGLAHALPRKTIMLTQNSNDVPFDLRSIRYLNYDMEDITGRDGFKFKRSLKKRLQGLTSK